METYLNVHPTSFPKPLNSKIKTKEFLLACTDFVKFIDIFGKSFAPARYDMSGNVTKITKIYEEDCDKNEYIEDMLLSEKLEGKKIATDALMWLRRGLNFFIVFFERLCIDESKQEDLSVYVREAYSSTLPMYHGLVTISVFSLLARVVPKRTLFLKSLTTHLAPPNSTEHAITYIQAYICNIKLCVQHLVIFYSENDLESHKKV